jgi:hypothetical protein
MAEGIGHGFLLSGFIVDVTTGGIIAQVIGRCISSDDDDWWDYRSGHWALYQQR